jgi:hypothetical protein
MEDIHFALYRMSQEESAILREGVPYVKIYRYNPKHLCPKCICEILLDCNESHVRIYRRNELQICCHVLSTVISENVFTARDCASN